MHFEKISFEQWQKEMPKSLLEQELFDTKIHIEFLTDRREKLNKEFRWTFANMKKLITIDQRIRELNNEINTLIIQSGRK